MPKNATREKYCNHRIQVQAKNLQTHKTDVKVFLALHHPRVYSVLPFAVRLPLSATVNIQASKTVSSVEWALSPLSL